MSLKNRNCPCPKYRFKIIIVIDPSEYIYWSLLVNTFSDIPIGTVIIRFFTPRQVQIVFIYRSERPTLSIYPKCQSYVLESLL